jgi:chromosome partitioning protein
VVPRRVAFINEKGGSAKTTLVANLGAYLALRRGRRVLAIDMDPQGQLAKVFGVDNRAPTRTAIDLLLDAVLGEHDESRARRAPTAVLPIVKTRIHGLDLIVANKALGLFPAGRSATIPIRPRASPPRSTPAPELARYDFVLFDAPPSFGPLTLNVLRAADEVVVPVPLTYLALDGCAELMRTLTTVRERYGHPRLRVTMVVPTFYRRTKLAHDILEQLKQRFPKEIAHGVIGFTCASTRRRQRASRCSSTHPSTAALARSPSSRKSSSCARPPRAESCDERIPPAAIPGVDRIEDGSPVFSLDRDPFLESGLPDPLERRLDELERRKPAQLRAGAQARRPRAPSRAGALRRRARAPRPRCRRSSSATSAAARPPAARARAPRARVDRASRRGREPLRPLRLLARRDAPRAAVVPRALQVLLPRREPRTRAPARARPRRARGEPRGPAAVRRRDVDRRHPAAHRPAAPRARDRRPLGRRAAVRQRLLRARRPGDRTRENFADLLDDDQLVLVFPEGIDGIRKTVTHRYRLQSFHVGFVEQALRAGAPIVPMAIVGATIRRRSSTT